MVVCVCVWREGGSSLDAGGDDGGYARSQRTIRMTQIGRNKDGYGARST